jgi:uncharacterized protein (TIGR02246 family)
VHPILKRLALSLWLLVLPAAPSIAADSDLHAADRAALLKVFREMEDGINAQDVNRMIAQMHPDATVIWLNGEVSRGHAEIRAYYDRMVKGENRILEKYTTAAKVGAPARFLGNGDVAVADGTMADEFFPVARGKFSLQSKWTSTSTKVDGQWKIASMHLSANVFSNSLIEEAKAAAIYTGAGGAIVGFAVAFVIGWLMRRRR